METGKRYCYIKKRYCIYANRCGYCCHYVDGFCVKAMNEGKSNKPAKPRSKKEMCFKCNCAAYEDGFCEAQQNQLL